MTYSLFSTLDINGLFETAWYIKYVDAASSEGPVWGLRQTVPWAVFSTWLLMELGFPAPWQADPAAFALFREGGCPLYKEDVGRGERSSGGWTRAIVSSHSISSALLTSYVICIIYHICPSLIPIIIYACFYAGLHIHCHSSTPTLLTLNAIPAVPVKNQFLHTWVTTTSNRLSSFFFLSFFQLSTSYHHYVSKGRWQIGLSLTQGAGSICACFQYLFP